MDPIRGIQKPAFTALFGGLFLLDLLTLPPLFSFQKLVTGDPQRFTIVNDFSPVIVRRDAAGSFEFSDATQRAWLNPAQIDPKDVVAVFDHLEEFTERGLWRTTGMIIRPSISLNAWHAMASPLSSTPAEIGKARDAYIAHRVGRGFMDDDVGAALSAGRPVVARAYWGGMAMNAISIANLLALGSSLGWVPRTLARRNRRWTYRCAQCGYGLIDVVGDEYNQIVCPECGHVRRPWEEE